MVKDDDYLICNEMIVVLCKVRSSLGDMKPKKKVAKSDNYLFFICVMCGSTELKNERGVEKLRRGSTHDRGSTPSTELKNQHRGRRGPNGQ